MSDHIIQAPDADLHQLHIRRSPDGQITLSTNNRKMYGEWGTFGFSESMARQMIEGLSAVLNGASRAITPCQLLAEQQEASARQHRAANATPTVDYDNLFGDS